jgi:metallo-beta-lactamase family protein
MYTTKKTILTILLAVTIFLVGCTTDTDTNVSYVGFGAQETVSGSSHTLKVGNSDYVIDVGGFYGEKGYANHPLPKEIDVDRIKGVFVTHSHADHIGRLPLLLQEGYKGPIYMTSVSRDIALVSLTSSINYMDFGEETFYYSKNNGSDKKPVYLDRFTYGQYEVRDQNRVYFTAKREELDKKGFYLAKNTISQLEEELLKQLNNQIKVVQFNQPFVVNNVNVEYLYTSHLPGSAMIKFSISDKSILFTGDIGSDRSPFLVKNQKVDEQIDFIFVEGTYGVSKIDNSLREQKYFQQRVKFREYIGNAVKNNKRVIIPAFVIDRTQQVLYEIKVGMEQGIIPADTIVKAYSPTSEDITALYQKYSNNKEHYSTFFSEEMFTDIFNIPNLKYNPRGSNNMYDLTIEHGEIAIMSSGMLSSAFALETVKMHIEDKNTHFVTVGYQSPEELGGRIINAIDNGIHNIEIDHENFTIRAELLKSPAFSGHGDINMITDILKSTLPEQVFIVHLNKEDGPKLKDVYSKIFPEAEVFVPKYKEEYHLFSY